MKWKNYIAFAAGLVSAGAAGAALWCFTEMEALRLLAVSVGFVYPCGMAVLLFWKEKLGKRRKESKERWSHVNTGIYRSGEDVIIPLADIRRARRKVIRQHSHFWSRRGADITAETLDEIGLWRC